MTEKAMIRESGTPIHDTRESTMSTQQHRGPIDHLAALAARHAVAYDDPDAAPPTHTYALARRLEHLGAEADLATASVVTGSSTGVIIGHLAGILGDWLRMWDTITTLALETGVDANATLEQMLEDAERLAAAMTRGIDR